MQETMNSFSDGDTYFRANGKVCNFRYEPDVIEGPEGVSVEMTSGLVIYAGYDLSSLGIAR